MTDAIRYEWTRITTLRFSERARVWVAASPPAATSVARLVYPYTSADRRSGANTWRLL